MVRGRAVDKGRDDWVKVGAREGAYVFMSHLLYGKQYQVRLNGVRCGGLSTALVHSGKDFKSSQQDLVIWLKKFLLSFRCIKMAKMATFKTFDTVMNDAKK